MDVRIAWFIERNFQNTRNFSNSVDSCFVSGDYNHSSYTILYKELYLIVKDEIYLFASTDVNETLEVLKKIINKEEIIPDTFTTIIANLAGKRF